MLRGARNITLFDTPLVLVKGTGLTPAERVAKRIMDVVISAIVLLILAPLMLLIAAAIKLEDGGPVFFRQKRLTRNGVEFDILKFRSMVVDAEKYAGAVLATDNDPRITKVGRIMRPFGLDELPQLWNILRGDMSVIGPRPALWNQEDLLAERDKYGANDVKPGLSGWAQICGRDELEIADKARLDGEYVRRMSFAFDCRCFFGTAISALRGDGIVEGGTGELHKVESKK